MLTSFFIENNFDNLYHLAKINLPDRRDNFSQSWFKENIQNRLIENLLNSEIVQTETSKNLFKESLFPYIKDSLISEFWNFTQILNPNKQPRFIDAKYWNAIISNSWCKSYQYNLNKMVDDISFSENISCFSNRIDKTEDEALEWLNSVIGFILKENDKLLDKYAIIPNQDGDFKKKEELWKDENIPEELKDILNIFDSNWRSLLQHNKINIFEPLIRKNVFDIAIEINSFIEKNNNMVDVAILELLSLFPNDGKMLKYREKIFSFSKKYYPKTPDKKILSSWDKQIWEKCDKFFVKKLLKDISEKESITNLNNFIESNNSKWLQKLIFFVVDYKFSKFLNDYAVIPNQKGIFKYREDLFIDKDYNDKNNESNENLKDIAELLGYDFREELLATEIIIDIKGKNTGTKDIASKISEKVDSILKNESINKFRDQNTKDIFSMILVWFHENKLEAEEYFNNLYDKRHRLRSDDEIIADMEFKKKILDNKYGYGEKDIEEIINNVSKEDLKNILANKYNYIKNDNENITNNTSKLDGIPKTPHKLLLSLGVSNIDDLKKAKIVFSNNREIIKSLRHFSKSSDFSYVHRIINRAKENVKHHLSQLPDYDISNWTEENSTIITGIKKLNKDIILVIRPADGGKIIIYYPNEVDTLEKDNSELWYDNGRKQDIYSFGMFLRKTKINCLPVP